MHLGQKQLNIRVGHRKGPRLMHVQVAWVNDVRSKPTSVGIRELAESADCVVVQREEILAQALRRLLPR
jgi:hypothetical protein